VIPNITKGSRMFGLIQYLAGPGRSNEHTDIHLVASSDAIVSVAPGAVLDAENSRTLGHEMDIPKAVFGSGSDKPHVFHMSVSLRADEGVQDDELWSKIAHDFMDEMGFSGSDGKPPCRWVAIRHGLSKAGNDHVHIAVSMIREDGTRWSSHNDRIRAQKAARALEKKHGLARIDGVRAERGYHPKEMEIARAQGLPELPRDTLQRKVRAAAVASDSEAEFVRRLRGTGVLVRPRFAQGSKSLVEGFSVAVKPATADASPVWFGGGRLARDLTLPKLREAWDTSADAVVLGVAEWRAAAAGDRVAADGREAVEPTAEEWLKYTKEVGELYERLKTAPLDDDALWARFRGAQDAFFAARDAVSAATDEEFRANLGVKERLLAEAEKLVPVKDLAAAKIALRDLQERWESAGKVPRADVQRIEARLRAVETTIRDADQAVWSRGNPEPRARAEGAAAQLETGIAGLEADLASAQAAGNKRKVDEARTALEARRAWLEQVQRAADDHRG